MTPGGTITRKDLIDDDALNYGTELVKKLVPAIEAMDQLVESAKGYSGVISAMKKSESQQAFLEAKQKERIEYEKVTNAIKLQQTALKEAEKTKQEVIKTRKLELDALAKEERAKRGTVKLTIEERVQNEANNRILRQEVRERLGLVSAYDKLNKARTDSKNKLRDLIATEGVSIEQIKKAKKEFDELAAKVKKADDAVDDFTKNVGNYPTIGKLAGSVKELFSAFGLAAGIGAAVSVLKGAYNTIVQFDQGIADLGAITGASGSDLEYLKNQAIELGKETKGGAVKVVEAYKLIASAKPELLENVESLNQVTKAVLTLSKASGLELPEAATALTDAMNQFGAPAEEAGIFIDALANGAKFGAAEIPQVTEALLKFGAVARSSNISIQESTALIELLAENGIKGAEAGTALRNVLLKISAPDALPKEAQRALKDLGISFDLLKDKSVPIQQKFEALRPLLADNGKLLKSFGFENTVAARNIIEHTDRLKDLTGKMFEYGTAQEQAEQRSNTLQGKTERLASTYDSFILSLNSGKGPISGFLSEVVELFDYILEGLSRMNSSWDQLYDKARARGKEQGIQIFQKEFQSQKKAGVSDAEAANNVVNQARNNLQFFSNELKKVEEELKQAEDSKFSLRNPFALSPKELKKQKEDLEESIAQQASIMKTGKEKIGSLNKIEIKQEEDKANELKTLSEDQKRQAEKAQKDAEKARKDYLAKMKQADDDEFALLKFRKEQEILIYDEISESEKENLDDRISALILSNNTQESLAEETAKYKLRQLSQYNDEVRDLTNEEIDILIKGLDNKIVLSKAEELVIAELKAKRKSLEKSEQSKIDKISEENFKKELDKINEIEKARKTAYEKDLILLNESLSKKEISQDQYDNKRKNLEDNLSKELFESQVKYLEESVSKLADTNDKKAKLEEVLHNLRLGYSEFLKNKRIADEKILDEKTKERVEKEKQLLKDTIVDNFNILGDALGIQTDKTQLFFEGLIDGFKNTADAAKKSFDFIREISGAYFGNRINNIDQEQNKWDEYYSEQIRLAGDDERQKKLLTEESERRRKELEKEKRKEQIKQAIFNKATAALNIGLNTAQAVMAIASTGGGTWYADFGISASLLTGITLGVGAAQLAAVLAAPLPKYEFGTDWHKGGPAVVGEVRPEVVIEPGKNPYVVSSPQILDLARGTQVVPSLEQYEKDFGKDNLDEMLKNSKGKIDNYNNLIQLNFQSKEMVEEMRLTRKAIERNKPHRPVAPKNVDIPHSIWAYTNTKWN